MNGLPFTDIIPVSIEQDIPMFPGTFSENLCHFSYFNNAQNAMDVIWSPFRACVVLRKGIALRNFKHKSCPLPFFI